MKRFFNKRTALPIFLSLTAVFFVIPHAAHAGFVDDLLTGGLRLIFEVIILPLAASILALAGQLLDAAINFSLHTAYIFSLSPAINLGWTIIRDIANMLFIFILIYISLGPTVQWTKFGTKQLLTQVIIAALLINFSLFITKAVIDVSNIFGNWLYGGIQNTLQLNRAKDSTSNPSISDLITQRLGILNWWSDISTNKNTGGGGLITTDPSKNIVGIVFRLIVVLVATYIFLYCAVLFISRSVTLLFLLVFSPIGFMGGVLPQINKYSKEWRDELTSAAIFPVAFLLLLYISLQFINSIELLGLTKGNWFTRDSLLGGVAVSTYFQYFLIIFLLHTTLKIAKDYSGEMGKMLGGMADGLGKLAVGATMTVASGGAALAARMGVSALVAGRNAEPGKGGAEARKAAWSTFASQMPLIKDPKSIWEKAKTRAKEGSYDVRNLGFGKDKNLGTLLSSATGVNINAKAPKDLKEEKEKFEKEYKVETDTRDILKNIEAIETQKAILADPAKAAQHAAAQTALDTARDEIKKKTGKMSNKDLESVTAKVHETARNLSKNNSDRSMGTTTSDVMESFTDQLKQNQTSHLAGSELPGRVKAGVQDARHNELAEVFDPHGPTFATPAARLTAIKRGFSKLSNTEVSKLDVTVLSDPAVADLLKPDHLKKVMEEYSLAQRSAIRTAITGTGSGASQKTIDWLTDNDIGQSF